jgi:hypothetical protein
MGEEQAKQEWLAKVLGVTLPNAGAAPAATGAKPAANPAKPASPANPAKPEAKAAKPAPNVAAALADAESFGVDPDDADTVGAGNPNLVSADLVGADARPQTTVTIHNFTGSNLILVAPTLKLPTARFVPAAPPLIGPLGKATFRVVESTIGANGGGGSLRYHIDRRRQNVDVTFAWEGVNVNITFSGKSGPFSTASDAVQDSETGNRYDLLVKDFADPDNLEVRTDIINLSGFPMTLVSATLEDPSATEFRIPPKTNLKDNQRSVIRAQGLDDAKPDAAGNVVYRIDRPGTPPHFARMTWRKGATPTGQMNPNDGMFGIQSATGPDRFQHKVVRLDGPPPAPPAPTKVTIVNTAGFAMEQGLLQLDSAKARFVSKPLQTLEGGRKSTFEVEAPNPEFPNTSGIVSYDVKFKPPDGSPETVVTINLDWRSEPPASFSKIVPPTDGISVDITGTLTDVVFTVQGPAIDFAPPQKAKQPTLRIGDKSADGWVEYLQESLNDRIGAGLTVNGVFDGKVLKAVKAFQRSFKDQGVLEDGIVGDETWSFLRDGVKEKPKTDGRQPHTFVEKGNEARWVRETAVVRFDPGQDALIMQAVSVGDVDQLKDRRVRIMIVNPDGVQKILERSIGTGKPSSTTGQGSEHEVKVEDFATLFDDKAQAGRPPPGNYGVVAFFDADLGGDQFNEVVTIFAT